MMHPALQQLKDIHLPPEIYLWPSAPGWIMLYIVSTAFFVYGLYGWYRRRKEHRTFKYALFKLNQLQALIKHNPKNINIAGEISTLIRRTALYYFERDAIAGLSGKDWLQFLNESGRTKQFTEEIGQLLIDAPYRKENNKDLAPLFALTQTWLKAITKIKRKGR